VEYVVYALYSSVSIFPHYHVLNEKGNDKIRLRHELLELLRDNKNNLILKLTMLLNFNFLRRFISSFSVQKALTITITQCIKHSNRFEGGWKEEFIRIHKCYENLFIDGFFFVIYFAIELKLKIYYSFLLVFEFNFSDYADYKSSVSVLLLMMSGFKPAMANPNRLEGHIFENTPFWGPKIGFFLRI
jgi:hypothetical protein